jgi:hypothetical protein
MLIKINVKELLLNRYARPPGVPCTKPNKITPNVGGGYNAIEVQDLDS